MPWTETSVVDQRTEFVLRVMRNVERFDELCREFGISRKTGYKWKERFLQEGLSGLGDQSRRPESSPREVSETRVCQIVKLRLAHPTWGARKLRSVLERTAGAESLPSESSFKRILDKAGLVERRRRMPAEQGCRLQTPVRAERPNQLWTIDFKGWWYTRNGKRFEPLTIRDAFSRYVLCAHALDDARTETVRQQMIRVFERHGLPDVIRSDNGSPFAARSAPLGLSRLSAWWLSLGINFDRDPCRDVPIRTGATNACIATWPRRSNAAPARTRPRNKPSWTSGDERSTKSGRTRRWECVCRRQCTRHRRGASIRRQSSWCTHKRVSFAK